MKNRERWILYSKKADFSKIAKQYGIDPVAARIMRNRGMETREEMDSYLLGDRFTLCNPHQMKGIDAAAAILEDAVHENTGVAIASDFDDDGIFSAMILYECLTLLGGRAEIFTPHRILEGYGLNDRIVEEAKEKEYGIILTCDNGIAALEAVDRAKKLGMRVIVTDHHEVPFRMENGKKEWMYPDADAIVDPHQEGCAYPYKNLCGTGVAFKLMQVLFERFHRPKEEIFRWLDYTAIATVADVMELTGENRILVKEGLKLLHHTDRLGLQALMEATSIKPQNLSSYHIGFVIGPCFNAAGRLDTVKTAIDLLKTKDPAEAVQLAAVLKAYNDERKDLTIRGIDQAEEIIRTAEWKDDKVYLIYLKNSHESVSGIIAGKIRERYARPVLVFADGKEEGIIKASGRSIDAYDMFTELSACRDLFERFGGHKMAAGLSMKKSDLPELRRRLKENCRLTEEDLCPIVMIDVPMPLSYITAKLILDLEKLEPFGRGNEKPLFALQHLFVRRIQRIGKQKNMLKLTVRGTDGYVMDALYFGDAEEMLAFFAAEYGTEAVEASLRGEGREMDFAAAYYPQVNEFRDQRTLQIVIQNYCRIRRKEL